MNRAESFARRLPQALRLLVCCAAFALAAPAPVRAQDGDARLRELFEQVELQLRRIDDLLNQASAGETSALGSTAPAGLDELLDAAQRRGQDVVRGIDEILEIARQMNQQSTPSSSSAGQGQPQPGQGEGGSRGQGRSQLPGESTPSEPSAAPGEQPGGEQPQGEQPQGQQPGERPGGEQPQDTPGDPQHPGEANDPRPENMPGDDPRGPETAQPPAPVRDAERWGDLPLHARETFRAAGDSEVPAAYRDWIDAYYRRLGKE